jgi:GAF domain-containing protein
LIIQADKANYSIANDCSEISSHKKMAARLPAVDSLTKEEKYHLLLQQAAALIENETDLIASLANISALVHEIFRFHWTGFYLVKESNGKAELVLGPFQGPVACTRIAFGKGVCGTAWKEHKIIRVDDVNKFPGHIACSIHSKSEIVVPVFKNGRLLMVLDIDSDQFNHFDETDEKFLCRLAELISKIL